MKTLSSRDQEAALVWAKETASGAAVGCEMQADGLVEIANTLAGVPNGMIHQAPLFNAAAQFRIAAAINRLAAALESQGATRKESS